MRHKVQSRTFGRRSGPRLALIRGLASNLIQAERITTTVAKAKELRMYVEPLVTLAKRGDLHARRQIAGMVYKKETVQKLFDQLAVRFKDRAGGYTRILKANQRLGDGAPMAIIEFLDRSVKGDAVASQGKKAPKKASAAKKAAPAAKAEKKTEAKASKTTAKKATKKSK